MKSEYMSKGKPSPGGFNANAYNKQSIKAGNKIKRNTKVIKLSGISSGDQRASGEYTARVSTKKLKPMSMTYGSNKGSKGTTIYRRGKI
jgi:hypothetical protein